MKYLILCSVIIGGSVGYLIGQQLPLGPGSISYDLIWNPAGTSTNNQLSFGLNYRQQWLSFKGAPSTGILYFEKPFWSQNMTIGTFLQNDQNGPISFKKLGFNYAYHIRWNDHQIALGTAIIIRQLTIKSSLIQTVDPDPILSRLDTEIRPDANIGLHFSTNIEDFEDEGSIFLGIYANGIKDLFTGGNGQRQNLTYDNSWHSGCYGGGTIVNESITWRPQFWIDYEPSSPLRYMADVSVSYKKNFAAGIYYSNDAQIHLKMEVGLENQALKDGTLRLYIFPSYNFSSISTHLGYSTEVGVRYDFVQDW